MAINYKKEIVKSDGRKLISGGPRDQQRRLKEAKDQQNLIEALRDEIKELRQVSAPVPEVKQVIPDNLFTGEQVDEAIRKSVLEALSRKKDEFDKQLSKVKNDLNNNKITIVELKAEIKSLKKEVKDKEEALKLERERNNQLMSQLSAKEEIHYENPDRPKMETSFIDPLEKNASDGLTAHIDAEEINVQEKDKIYSNVEKLKGLMGKLPTK
jgi:archaellum component FlaC